MSIPVPIPSGALPISDIDNSAVEDFVAKMAQVLKSGTVGVIVGTKPAASPTMIPVVPATTPPSLAAYALDQENAQLFFRQLGFALLKSTLIPTSGGTWTGGPGTGLTTLMSDVTGSGVGTVSTTIAPKAVTLAKMADMVSDKLIGRSTDGLGSPEALGVTSGITISGGNVGLGAITPAAVASVGPVTGSNLSGINTGDQTVNLTGDVTGTGTGTFPATIANKAVTLPKMADIATGKLIGRSTAGTGTPEAITVGAGLDLSAGTLSLLGGGGGGGGVTTLTGDVTGVGLGTVAATIAPKAVTLAKLDDVPSGSIFGRSTAGLGVPELLTLGSGLTLVSGVIGTAALDRLVSSLGAGATDIVTRIGTTLTDASINVGAKLLSIRTGIGTGGSELEKAYFNRDGSFFSWGTVTGVNGLSSGTSSGVQVGTGGMGPLASTGILSFSSGWALSDTSATETFRIAAGTLLADPGAQILTVRNGAGYASSPILSLSAVVGNLKIAGGYRWNGATSGGLYDRSSTETRLDANAGRTLAFSSPLGATTNDTLSIIGTTASYAAVNATGGISLTKWVADLNNTPTTLSNLVWFPTQGGILLNTGLGDSTNLRFYLDGTVGGYYLIGRSFQNNPATVALTIQHDRPQPDASRLAIFRNYSSEMAQVTGNGIFKGAAELSVFKTPSAVPVATAAVLATTGGALTTGLKYYRVTTVTALGESLPSAECSVNVTGGTSTNMVRIAWTPISGATSYKVYGRATGTEQYLATASQVYWTVLVPAGGSTNFWDDDGSITPSGAMPTSDTASYAATEAGITKFGYASTNGSAGSTAFGSNAYGSRYGTAVGYLAQCGNDLATTVGYGTSAYYHSVTVGQLASTGGTDSVGIGNGTGVAGSQAVGVGAGASVGALSSVAIGYGATDNNFVGALALGQASKAQRYGEMVRSADGLNPTLRSWSVLDWFADTTDATPTEIFLNGTASNRALLLNSSAFMFKMLVTARDNSGHVSKGWELSGIIQRGANAAATAVSTITSNTFQVGGTPAWTCVASADTTNGALIVTVTGAAATTIRWNAKADFSEVRF